MKQRSFKLGDFRWLLFGLQRTRSPLQPTAGLTGTLFSEIDNSTLTINLGAYSPASFVLE